MANPREADKRNMQRVTFLPRSARASKLADKERHLLQGLLRTAPPEARELVTHYYVSAKSWPLVLLLGTTETWMRRLFYVLADGISGCSDGQVQLLTAQAPWQEHVKNGRYFDSIQGRFNTVAFLDLLAEAGSPGNEGRAYFLCLERTAPLELDAYIDLYLSTDQDRNSSLPVNLSLTAIVSEQDGVQCLPPFLVNRVGLVQVLTPLEQKGTTPLCPPVGWQRLFLRSAVRDQERARKRLSRLGLLERTEEILSLFKTYLPITLEPELERGILLYTANSFTADGEGLFQSGTEENLWQAADLQLSQRLLPCIEEWCAWDRPQWEQLSTQLNGLFPRSRTRMDRILIT
jgi:hypothetical protein